MNVRYVCYEAIQSKKIALNMLEKLQSLQSLGSLSELDRATVLFTTGRVTSGKIRVISSY